MDNNTTGATRASGEAVTTRRSRKIPAMQFYPGDWRKDPGVQSLNYFDRGVWFEVLCLMFESEDRGKLLLAGKKMPDEALAQLLGLDNQSLNQTVTTLLTRGVASIDTETGALMCRRMVRDEMLRRTRSNCGKLGGNPFLLKQTAKQNVTTRDNQNGTTRLKQKTTPSTSVEGGTGAPVESPPVPVPLTEIELGQLEIRRQICATSATRRQAGGCQ
jgi:hypothetical protein